MSTLSNPAISKALPGETLRDDSIPGLQLRCFPGRKSYYLYYRTKTGTERRPKIGDHGIITLAKAREIAKEMLAEVAAGRDPKGDWNAVRKSPTMKELCAEFMEKHGSRKKSAKEFQRLIDTHITTHFKVEKVREITFQKVDDFHKGMEGTPYQANRILSLLSKMFNLAEKWGYRDQHTNPCRHVSFFPELKRKRFMKGDEAPRIAAALIKHEETSPRSVAFLYLLIYSGARPGEIANAEWPMLQGNRFDLPDSKTGQKSVYLAPQAMRILDSLPRTSDTITGIKSPKKVWEQVRKEAGCPDLRMYPDLRRTFATAGISAGVNISQIAELLGHKNEQTTKIYGKLENETAELSAAKAAAFIERMMKPTIP